MLTHHMLIAALWLVVVGSCSGHIAEGYLCPAGDTVNEAELRGLFANAAGFRQLKLIRGNKSTTCFVEFSDIPTAMACHAAQQVASSLNSWRGL